MMATWRRRRTVTEAIERSDYWRRSPASVGGGRGHKEWMYFCAFGDGIDLVVNLSVADRVGSAPTGSDDLEEAHVTWLARTRDGRWRGQVDRCARSRLSLEAGRIGARFGDTTLRFANGRYLLDLRSDDPPFRAVLTLTPVARPAVARSVPLGSSAPMHWFVVPRLDVAGQVSFGATQYPLRDGAAYHDHNWGQFVWGGDFAWEWGIVLCTEGVAWTLVYYRISDRGRHHVSSQGVLLWCGDEHYRSFRDHEVDVRGLGSLRLGRCLRVPRIMSLALPGTAGDYPARLEITARSGRDVVRLAMVLTDGAQIGVPNDVDDRFTLITECRARATVRGLVRDHQLTFEAPAIVEFNGAD